jgi:hypothetical protein
VFKEISKMEQRYDAVLMVIKDGYSVSEVARKVKVSRQTGFSFMNARSREMFWTGGTLTSVTRLWRSLLGVVVAMTLAVPVGASLALASSSAATILPCTASALTPTVGRGGAAGGTAYETLLLTSHVKGTNALTGWCTLSGTPTTEFGNDLVRGTGIAEFVAVGPAATKLTIAGRGKTVTLKPGAVASVTIGIETAVNFEPPSRCHRANVSRVRLVFDHGTTFDYTLRRTQVCTKIASTTTSGVVLGTRYP